MRIGEERLFNRECKLGEEVVSTIKRKRISVPAIKARKGSAQPLVSLSAYSAPMARQLDPYVELMVVGDSVGMVLYGMDSTMAVTLETMILHGSAVVRGSERACIIVDMPFGTYQESPEQAFRNASRVMAQTGCSAVKIEGGIEMAQTIRFLTERGVPVMGHIGLMPQSVQTAGGYGARGKTHDQVQRLLADAKAVDEAGAFAMVIESVIEPVAREITSTVSAVTIGIGASPACDGQTLVTEDLVGLFSEFTPPFVKRYAELGPQIGTAVKAFADDVRARRFPGPEHTFRPKAEAQPALMQ